MGRFAQRRRGSRRAIRTRRLAASVIDHADLEAAAIGRSVGLDAHDDQTVGGLAQPESPGEDRGRLAETQAEIRERLIAAHGDVDARGRDVGFAALAPRRQGLLLIRPGQAELFGLRLGPDLDLASRALAVDGQRQRLADRRRTRWPPGARRALAGACP